MAIRRTGKHKPKRDTWGTPRTLKAFLEGRRQYPAKKHRYYFGTPKHGTDRGGTKSLEAAKKKAAAIARRIGDDSFWVQNTVTGSILSYSLNPVRGTGTSSYTVYPSKGSPKTFGYLKSARAWAQEAANRDGVSAIIYGAGRKTWHVAPKRTSNPARTAIPSQFVPARVRRLPGGRIHIELVKRRSR